MLAVTLLAALLSLTQEEPALAVTAAPPREVPDYITALSEKQRESAKKIIAAMIENPRGPYAGISWFCFDGAVLPPKLNACVEHGGGEMYGVFGPEAQRLHRMGVYVGTVLAALEPIELIQDAHYRAKALVIEKYLERALDGWVLRGAKTYRGFRQDEDEEKAARTHLVELTRDRTFFDRHRALIVRLSKALPYGRGNENLAAEYRALAAIIGDADRGFAQLRFKIHALPEPADIAQVDAYVASAKTPELAEKAKELAAKMRVYFDPATRLARIRDIKQWIRDPATKNALQLFADTDPAQPTLVLANGMALIETAEKAIRRGTTIPERNLLLVHAMGLVEEVWLGLAADAAKRPMTREQALADLDVYVRAAGHIGLLSRRELDAARAWVANATADKAGYVASVDKLGRVLEWARARVSGDLAIALARYQAVEPQAARVVDDILRGGVMLPLATVLDRLTKDAEALRGGGHRLWSLGGAASSARGENHGIALGTLVVVPAGGGTEHLERHQIALLNDLPPELPPVAGVVTVGSVGSLSHVAMLARNLGIPLASVEGDVARALPTLAGKELLLAVSGGRRVALGLAAELAAEQRALIVQEAKKDASATSFTIDAATLDLATARLMRLDEISEKDSGIRVGPKAGELGRLRRLFPNRVSNAAVIPFGAFVQHVDRPGANGAPSPLAELRDAYAKHKEQRAAGADAAAADQALLDAMAKFRGLILSLPFVAGFEAEVAQAMKGLGDPSTTGVFVRSDTNVEDQKDFTGAGLNLTVPNRVGLRNIVQAIREVWASPFTERSFRWRQRLLTNPEHVYPSVLLHKTVPADMSGVLVTADVETGGPGITVSVAEGVAAVVDGGAPETVVIQPDGVTRLITSPRSATRKVIPKAPKQGVETEPVQGLEPLLGAKHLAEVKKLAGEVLQRVHSETGAPWDVEYAFVGSKAYLIQIRPLRINRVAKTHPYLLGLDVGGETPSGAIDLGAPIP